MALEFAGGQTGTSQGTDVTSGSGGVAGAYVELIASTARESHRLLLQIRATDSDATRHSVVTLAVGGSGSEVDQFSIIIPHGIKEDLSMIPLEIPWTIASAQRVSVKTRSNKASTVVRVTLCLSDDDSLGTGTNATLLGESGEQGTAIDPGGSANTKGSWVEISSSVPHDVDYLGIVVDQRQNGAINVESHLLVDIGTGAAASETVLIENIQHTHDNFESAFTFYPVLTTIASGTRIAARAQCSDTDATDRVCGVSILALNLTAPAGGGGGATQLINSRGLVA